MYYRRKHPELSLLEIFRILNDPRKETTVLRASIATRNLPSRSQSRELFDSDANFRATTPARRSTRVSNSSEFNSLSLQFSRKSARSSLRSEGAAPNNINNNTTSEGGGEVRRTLSVDMILRVLRLNRSNTTGTNNNPTNPGTKREHARSVSFSEDFSFDSSLGPAHYSDSNGSTDDEARIPTTTTSSVMQAMDDFEEEFESDMEDATETGHGGEDPCPVSVPPNATKDKDDVAPSQDPSSVPTTSQDTQRLPPSQSPMTATMEHSGAHVESINSAASSEDNSSSSSRPTTNTDVPEDTSPDTTTPTTTPAQTTTIPSSTPPPAAAGRVATTTTASTTTVATSYAIEDLPSPPSQGSPTAVYEERKEPPLTTTEEDIESASKVVVGRPTAVSIDAAGRICVLPAQ